MKENISAPILFKKKDLLFVLAVLIIAAVSWFFLLGQNAIQGTVAVVSVGYGKDKTELIFPLNKPTTHTIEANLPVTLLVENDSIQFINSVCPDHRCEAFGKLSHEGDWAACVPAGVSVQIREQ